MAMSSCPKCDNHFFELVESEPRTSNWKYYYLQCTYCGAVVGFTDYHNLGNLMEKQSEAIKKIAQQLKVVVDL